MTNEMYEFHEKICKLSLLKKMSKICATRAPRFEEVGQVWHGGEARVARGAEQNF